MDNKRREKIFSLTFLFEASIPFMSKTLIYKHADKINQM